MRYLKNIYFVLIAVLVVSCYNDKENYNYEDLPLFHIDSMDMYNYVRMQNEKLEISPVVKYAGAESDLTYLWTIRPESPVYDDEIDGYHLADTLAEEKTLDYTVNLAVNKYIVDFTIYNSLLDIKQVMSFNLDIQSAYSKGWMLLVENEGESDIYFIKTNKFFPDIDDASEGVFKNTYSIANGNKLSNGKFLVQDYLWGGNNDIYVLDENGGGKLSTVDFSIESTYEDLFHFPESINKPTAFGFSRNGSRFVINNEELHCNWNRPKFDVSLVSDDMGYKAAPFILYTTGPDAPGTVIYDKLNRRFLPIPLFTKKTGVYEEPAPGALFDMNNIGLDIVHMEIGFNGNAFNIFKEPTSADYYLYVFDINKKTQAPVGLYSMENCADIAHSACFAFGTRGNVCYYSANNKIYQYNYLGTNTSDLEYEFAVGEEVVSMKVYKDMSEEVNPVYDSKVLVVATYNESAKEGKVYMFDINETNGAVSTSGIKSYNIEGKVLDMGIKK